LIPIGSRFLTVAQVLLCCGVFLLDKQAAFGRMLASGRQVLISLSIKNIYIFQTFAWQHEALELCEEAVYAV
jgi:hypothetical protein